MPASSARRRRAAGFSLIEVLIALAIVGLGLAAAAGTFGVGLSGHEASRDAAIALSLAEGKLAEAGVAGTLREGNSEGSFADRFDWQVSVMPYADPGEDQFGLVDKTMKLYRIGVSVAWQDGHRERRLALDTVRLGRAPPP